jgi:hypothetical protein
MNKSDMQGSTYMVLVNGEYAGWFNIAGPGTDLLRAGLSSTPILVDLEDVDIDIPDFPKAGANYFWNGKSFELRELDGQ